MFQFGNIKSKFRIYNLTNHNSFWFRLYCQAVSDHSQLVQITIKLNLQRIFRSDLHKKFGRYIFIVLIERYSVVRYGVFLRSIINKKSVSRKNCFKWFTYERYYSVSQKGHKKRGVQKLKLNMVQITLYVPFGEDHQNFII